jgi:uncharacterized protein YaaQ
VKRVVSVVHSQDAHPLVGALAEREFRATLVSTTGGFLREGNATVLVGTADENVDEVLELIQENCHKRTTYVSAFPTSTMSEGSYATLPIRVEVGGATVFVIDVERFERF